MKTTFGSVLIGAAILATGQLAIAEHDDYYPDRSILEEGHRSWHDRYDYDRGHWHDYPRYHPDPRARPARGRITSRPCPYKCSLVGIPKSHCRDWREGNVCYIEDLR